MLDWLKVKFLETMAAAGIDWPGMSDGDKLNAFVGLGGTGVSLVVGVLGIYLAFLAIRMGRRQSEIANRQEEIVRTELEYRAEIRVFVLQLRPEGMSLAIQLESSPIPLQVLNWIIRMPIGVEKAASVTRPDVHGPLPGLPHHFMHGTKPPPPGMAYIVPPDETQYSASVKLLMEPGDMTILAEVTGHENRLDDTHLFPLEYEVTIRSRVFKGIIRAEDVSAWAREADSRPVDNSGQTP